ncbi:MAG: MoxR family ATPase [Opitutales bacterium]|nr:MoxR family ATPase [Opitutales bacterium]
MKNTAEENTVLTPRQLTEALTKILAAGRTDLPVMLWGPPGVGKSALVGQLAGAHGLSLTDLRISQLAPTDLRGVPSVRRTVTCWNPPEFLPRTGAGILFLDEITMAPPVMQGIAHQLVLDRAVGSYRLPEKWFVWAAGNRVEDRSAVYEMPKALANRFLHFEVKPCGRSFAEFAAAHPDRVDPAVVAFLHFRPDLLLDPGNGTAHAWPSPRSWEKASACLRAGLGVGPAVGRGVEIEFRAFVKMADRLPSIGAILKGGGGEVPFPEEFSERHALVCGLVRRAEEPDALLHGFRWLTGKAAPEWNTLFLTIAAGAIGRWALGPKMAAALAQNPKLSGLLRQHRGLLAKAHDPDEDVPF